MSEVPGISVGAVNVRWPQGRECLTMWEWLVKGICQKKGEETHVWNLEHQQHFTAQRPRKSLTRPSRGEECPVVDLDWNRRPRIDSYYIEGTSQTIIRQEVYKKIFLQKKSPYYTKDLFSISMRNVNEKIISERKIIIPLNPEVFTENYDFPSEESSIDIATFGQPNITEVIVEPPQSESDSLNVPFRVENDSDDVTKRVLSISSDGIVSRERDRSSSSSSGKSDSVNVKNLSDTSLEERPHDLDTMVTDLDDVDSIEHYTTLPRDDKPGSEWNKEEFVDTNQLTSRSSRYGRVSAWWWLKEDMPALERTCNGALALHYAAARGCLDCVRLLVDASTDLSANTQMDNDVTPVYLAAQEGHLEVLKFLVLEAGGSLYVRAKDGMAPVHAASQMGCLNCLKWMIQDQGVDPNLRDGDGATPLHFAASRGHVEVVRWLLRHGAKLVIDKYGKSPINDAAENHQVECLNLLVQRGTTPDYHDDLRQGKLHGCTCRAGDNTVCSYADCVNYNDKEPFYLHPPGTMSKDSPPVKDGLYINPMTLNMSQGQGGHGFYLHNPQEVPYHRVKDLFNPDKPGYATYSKPPPPPPPPPLTVKVEVHSSSSGAGSDENMSSSDLSERGSGSGSASAAGADHDYEDIYLVRNSQPQPRSCSRDSGSHSRSNSVSSTQSNIIIHTVTEEQTPPELPLANGLNNYSKPQITDVKSTDEQKAKTKLNHSHSMPYHQSNSRALKRVVSEPGSALPPPPPPPPPEDLSPASTSLPSSPEHSLRPEPLGKSVSSNSPPSSPTHSSEEESTLRAASVTSSTCSPDTPAQTTTQESSASVHQQGPNLVNKQMVLPFIPPKFPSSDGDEHSLIKPSEYLRALGSKPPVTPVSHVVASVTVHAAPAAPPLVLPQVHTFQLEDKTGCVVTSPGPPPPPLPASPPVPATPTTRKADQPLGTISIQDLNSVQLRRTNKLSKTMSAPLTSLSGPVEAPFQVAKQDLIEELKKSKDITGIKKMKVEKVKMEEQHEKELVTEIAKHLSVDSFVEKIPDKDTTGNPIPPWKRQMLAKKAAEKARKEMEEVLAREAEERRLQSIPAWKRQLISKKTDDKPTTIYTTQIIDDKKPPPTVQIIENTQTKENKENNKPEPAAVHEKTQMTTNEEAPQIMPWRAQLRKTNSTLNLLE